MNTCLSVCWLHSIWVLIRQLALFCKQSSWDNDVLKLQKNLVKIDWLMKNSFSIHEDPHKILFGSLLEAIVGTDAICNYITESQKSVWIQLTRSVGEFRLDWQFRRSQLAFYSVRVKSGMSLWHGMWHDLRNGIIMRNVILAEWLFDINYTKKRAIFLREAALLNTAGANQQGLSSMDNETSSSSGKWSIFISLYLTGLQVAK